MANQMTALHCPRMTKIILITRYSCKGLIFYFILLSASLFSVAITYWFAKDWK